MKFKAPSRVLVRCLRSQIWTSSRGQTRLGRHSRSQRKKQHSTICTKAQWSSPRGQTTSRNPNFALFAPIFWKKNLILYQLRKHTNFQLNWMEGVAYWNSTSFILKFKASPRLWVRWLRIWIWASSHGEILHGRHSRSQRKKQQNTISTKAQRSPPRGQGTSRNPNFALFARIFLYFFWFCIT
jgi:hypothetical protein